MKMELYQCDYQQCPNEAETRNLDNDGWVLLRTSGAQHFHFDTEDCLFNWLQERLLKI